MSALCLTVLPFRLRIAKLSKSALPAYAHSLLRILTKTRHSFWSWAEANDDTISMIAPLSLLQHLPRGPDLVVASERWRCLIVSEGEILNGASLICMVSEQLAKAGFSIFYVSGAATDYVLVTDDQFDAVMACLARNLSVVVDRIVDAGVEADEAAAVLQQEAAVAASTAAANPAAALASLAAALSSAGIASAAVSTPSAPAAPVASDLSQARMRLQTLPDRLVLHTIAHDDIAAHFRKLLRLMLFASSQTRFFSFLWVEEQLSLILDTHSYARLVAVDEEQGDDDDDGGAAPASALLQLPETWRAIRVVGEFGFTETGIVYALSAPLKEVPTFYISTFKTDFIMVGEERLDEVESILAERFELIKHA